MALPAKKISSRFFGKCLHGVRVKPITVLFVCLGNICRSPAAEIIFRHLVETAGLKESIAIDSAGTIGIHRGSGPDARMCSTLRGRGYAIAGKSRPITEADLETMDHILVMDQQNLADVREMDPSQRSWPKIRLLTDYCTKHTNRFVPDPYYGGSQGFELVADLLEDACANFLSELRAKLPNP